MKAPAIGEINSAEGEKIMLGPEITPEEWCFSPEKVSKDEIVPCLLYEYARESPLVRRVSDAVHEYTQMKIAVESITGPICAQTRLDPTQNRILDTMVMELAKITTVPPYDNHGLRMLLLLGDIPRDAPPWQRLSTDQKSKFAFFAVKESPFKRLSMHALPIFQANIEKIAMARKAIRAIEEKELCAKYGGNREAWPKSQFSQDDASSVDDDGTETTAVCIDWGAFSDRQIRDGFSRWIRHNRPFVFPEPKSRGKQKTRDMRAALSALGVVRVCSRFTLCETKNKLPDFYEQMLSPLVAPTGRAFSSSLKATEMRANTRSVATNGGLSLSLAEKEMYQKRGLAKSTYLRLFPCEKYPPPSWNTAGASRKNVK